MKFLPFTVWIQLVPSRSMIGEDLQGRPLTSARALAMPLDHTVCIAPSTFDILVVRIFIVSAIAITNFYSPSRRARFAAVAHEWAGGGATCAAFQTPQQRPPQPRSRHTRQRRDASNSSNGIADAEVPLVPVPTSPTADPVPAAAHFARRASSASSSRILRCSVLRRFLLREAPAFARRLTVQLVPPLPRALPSAAAAAAAAAAVAAAAAALPSVAAAAAARVAVASRRSCGVPAIVRQ